ncbi:hypothetical protein J6590_105457 [Homalodisca vitripennis]|nr:hypothetical protein J6590_105457 [Homalodisca vitripennis]
MKIICGFVIFTLQSSTLVVGLPQFLDEPDQSVTLVVEPDAYPNPQIIYVPERPTTEPTCPPGHRYDGYLKCRLAKSARMGNENGKHADEHQTVLRGDYKIKVLHTHETHYRLKREFMYPEKPNKTSMTQLQDKGELHFGLQSGQKVIFVKVSK